MKLYSHSRLSAFEQCPLKYKYKYIDKIPEPKKSIEASLGKAVHEALEWIYKSVKFGRIPTLDSIIERYAEAWNNNYSQEDIIVKKDITPEDYFNKGVGFLVTYYTNHKPFDDNTLEVEKRIVVRLDEDGEYHIQGFIDRLVYNREKNRYEIHDYKTANSLPTQENVDSDRQLALYAIAIKENFGLDKEVILVWHYLAHDKRIESSRKQEELDQLRLDTIQLIKQIENTTKFPPYITKLCDWCQYKNICPAWKPGYKSQQFIDKQEPLDIF